MTSSNDIRQKFIDFFVAKGHELVPSSSLVPHNDATLLFTNAGMVQFKDVFLGREQRSCRRATSAQRCVRAGGKHNDLENVGYTARHHTFFEMLGNFSFGDYFKREAIEFAWEFLTQAIDLPADRLWVTVYEEDNEAADIWLHDIGLDPGRLARIGATDNFWRMGDTGPCGPCSEIFYDHGPRISGGPPGSATADGDRFVEIWNLVFMEFNRSADGRLTPLPHPAVDTGMGLERLAAVLQGVYDNYDTDLFRHLIGAATDLLAVADPTSRSLRVIADHIRACAFLIADGVAPGNEGRGYVLRRLVRRAIRHGHQLGASEPFFYRLVAPLEQQMGVAYPILGEQSRNVQRVLREEEERFAETLAQGMHLLNQDLARLSGDTLSGATLFRLYDTYGFPVDLTADIVRERGLSVDMEGFEAAMQEQRTRARAASHFVATEVPEVAVSMHTEFTGYEQLADQAEVVGLLRDGATLARLDAGDEAIVILDRTPFYAESGGQVGDHGYLELAGGQFEVTDARKLGDTAIGHSGRLLSGALAIGDSVTARVAADDRQATALNHSATHLLHAALRQVLGGQVTQKGSLVDAHRLRFDFSNPRQVTQQELQTVEALVNDHIRANHEVQTAVMGMDDAVRSGAMALFGEKYGAQVRVLKMDDFSVELCGGTHVRRTGDIGLFKILSESGVASGIRRIEAMTGAKALAWTEDQAAIVRDLSARLQTGPAMLGDKLAQLLLRQKALEKELAQVQGRLASHSGDDLGDRAVLVGDIKVLAARVEAEPKALRELVDQLKNKLGRAVVLVAAVNDGKVNLVAGVTGDLTDRVAAGDLVNQVALQVGGKGGGRADMAMAGGKDPTHLDQALAGVVPWVAERLGVSG